MDMTNLIFKVTLENEAAKFKPKYLMHIIFAVGQRISSKLALFENLDMAISRYFFETLTLFSRSHLENLLDLG